MPDHYVVQSMKRKQSECFIRTMTHFLWSRVKSLPAVIIHVFCVEVKSIYPRFVPNMKVPVHKGIHQFKIRLAMLL